MRSYGFLIHILFFLILGLRVQGANITAVTSGNWENGSTWTGGIVPQCGDSIIIGSGKTVQVTTLLDFSACAMPPKITIAGTLNFQTGKKLKLPCGSIIHLTSSGIITAGNGGGNSNYIEICAAIVWNAAQGTLTGPLTLPATTLPVKLLHFVAFQNNEQIIIQWMTATEINCDKFRVEKSYDGSTYSEIEILDGVGTSSNLNKYTVTDRNPKEGLQFYRLQQIDFDGKTVYYKPVSTRFNSEVSFSLHPNPGCGELYVNISKDLSDQTALLIINYADGRERLSKQIMFDEILHDISLLHPLEYLPAGSYLVTLAFSEKTFTRFVVVR